MNVQEVNLDLSKESPGYPIVRIGQDDSSGTTIRATVYDNGSTPTLTGMTVKMHMRLPDGKSYAEGGNCSVSGNVITCVVDESRFAVVDGYTNDAYFSLTSGTTIYSTSRFRVKVEKAASKDADPAGMYTDDVEAATRAAREAADAATEAIEQIGTAVDDAQQAADDAAQAVTDAQTAIQDADAAKQSATTAASQATAAANNANSKANAANTAANNANAATSAANDATTRANSAIDAMGDISEQAVPVMSADVRGGAKIQPNSGLEIAGTDNLQVRLALESDGDARGGLAQVTAKGHAEQVQTTGKNLLPREAISSSVVSGVTFKENPDGSFTANGTATANIGFAIGHTSPDNSLSEGTYTLSGCPAGGSQNTYSLRYFNNSTDTSTYDYGNGGIRTLTSEQASKWNSCWVYIMSGTTVNNLTFRPQFELGSTATDYEPYSGGAPSPTPDNPQEIHVVRGHEVTGKTGRFVDLVVKQGNTTLSTTPIPLPQRGWVGSLPDGTDTLAIDGAGKCEWELADEEVVYDGSSDENWLFAAQITTAHYTGSLAYIKAPSNTPTAKPTGYKGFFNRFVSKVTSNPTNEVTEGCALMFNSTFSSTSYVNFYPGAYTDVADWKTWLQSHPVTVLYPLATPTVEQCGYIDMPTDIPDGATVTIPELDALGIRYFIDSGVTELARQWYARAHSEYEDRIAALEQAVAELATS